MIILRKNMVKETLIGILLFAICSCQHINQLSSDKKITKEIQTKFFLKSKFVDLSDLNYVDWESLLILGPYSNIENVGDELNLDLENVKENSIKSSDNFNLIIFLKNGKAKKISELSRNFGDFIHLEQVILKNDAKYIKSKDGKNVLMNTEIDIPGIPINAFWAGKNGYGNWFDIKYINRERNKALISIYDEKKGDLLLEKTFSKICNIDNLHFIKTLKNEIDYFDGEKIHLNDSCFLMQY